MTIEQDFLPYAVGTNANVLSQTAYAALSSLLQNGLTSGIVPSNELNKILRQPSIIASVVAQFIVAQTGQPAIDDGTTATLLQNLGTAVSVMARQNPVLVDTGAVNAYVVTNLAAFTAYPTISGLTIDVSIVNANTGASTLNVDGLGTKPIYGLGLQPLQGGELIVKGVACLMYIVASTVNSGNGAWVIMECAGGAQQVGTGTASQHAATVGQVQTSALGSTAASDPTFADNSTKPASTNWVRGAMSAIAIAAGFSISLGSAGYIKFPSWLGGLIIQWGGSSTAAAGSTISVTLPLAFPNNNFRQFLSSSNGTTWYVSASSNTAITGFNFGTISGGFSYLCVGN